MMLDDFDQVAALLAKFQTMETDVNMSHEVKQMNGISD